MSGMINIGTKENPVLVPEKALHPETPEGNEYYGMIADGSVELPDENLKTLLDTIKDGDK